MAKKKFNNKKKYSEDRREREFDGKRESNKFKSQDNDWRWYATNEQMLRDVASYPYSNPLGGLLPLGQFADGFYNTSIPGIMTLDFLPMYGTMTWNTSSANLAARNIYTYVRHMNSGHANYEANDLLLYLIAMDQANMYLSWMKRLYGIVSLTNYKNRYVPLALARSMGVAGPGTQAANPNQPKPSIFDRLADFQYYINNFALRMGSLAIPNHMAIFRRHQWMCENIYADDAAMDKAQLYVFKPGYVGYYSVKGAMSQEGQGCIEWLPMPGFDAYIYSLGMSYGQHRSGEEGTWQNHLWTLDDIISMGEMLLSGILTGAGEEDFNIISGDILKAYGPGGVYRAEGVDPSYSVYPVYSPEVLSQIENAEVFPWYAPEEQRFTGKIDFWNIRQLVGISPDAEANCCVMSTTRNAQTKNGLINPYLQKRVLNSHLPDPGPADTIVASRLMGPVLAVRDSNGFMQYTVNSCGSELVIGMRIWTNQLVNGVLAAQPTDSLYTIVNIPVDAGTYDSKEMTEYFMWYLNNYGKMSLFDYHPIVRMNAYVTNGEDIPATDDIFWSDTFLGDVSNYTVIDPINLENMNEMAILSLFGVEQFGRGYDLGRK